MRCVSGASPVAWHATVHCCKQVRAHTHTPLLNPFSHHRSTRWMATRDARRSKSPPAAGRYSPAAAAAAAIGDPLTVVASLLKQSKLFFLIAPPLIGLCQSALASLCCFWRLLLSAWARLLVMHHSIMADASMAARLMTLIGRGARIGRRA